MIPGIILPVVVFTFAVREAERRLPILDETPEMTQKERDFVTSIISRNLRRSEVAESGENLDGVGLGGISPGRDLSGDNSPSENLSENSQSNSGGEMNEP